MIPNQAGQSLTSSEVLSFARRYIGETYPVGYCQKFVRMAFGSAGGAGTAVEAWTRANVKHTSGEPKIGAAVYWGGGAGHVAIYAGNGMVISTDAPKAGQIGLVSMDYITKQWGKPYLGWSADNNEKTITSWDAKPVTSERGGASFNGTGGSYAGGPGSTAGGGVAKDLSMRELAQTYGYSAQFFKSSPELQALIKKAVRAQWTTEEFAARFQNTKWYRQHTDAQREWATLESTRPGEANRRLAQTRNSVVEMYRQMGVAVPSKRLDQLVRTATVSQWSDDEIRDAIAAEFDYKPGHTYGGLVGQTVDDFRQMAGQYLVPISNKTMDQWTTNVLRGEASPEDFASYMKAQAKSMWDDPGIHDAIDRGITVDQYLDPYRQMAANTLGVNPDEIDWTDPKWQHGLFQRDPKTGARTMMSLGAWGRALRTDDRFGFDKSAQALFAGQNLGANMARLLGGNA